MPRTRTTPHVRLAATRDIPALMVIDAEVYRAPLSLDDWIELLTQHAHLMTFVAVVDDTVVGYANYLLTQHAIWLERIAVWSKVRRHGLGRALLGKLERRVQHGKRDKCSTLVPETATGTLEFFRACGWRASRIYRPFQPTDGTSSLVEMSYVRRDIGLQVLDSILCGDGKVVR